jgi:hypothetical protein
MVVLFVPCVQLCDEMLFNFDPPMCLNCEVYSLGLAIPSHQLNARCSGFLQDFHYGLFSHLTLTPVLQHLISMLVLNEQSIICFCIALSGIILSLTQPLMIVLIPLLEIRIYIIPCENGGRRYPRRATAYHYIAIRGLQWMAIIMPSIMGRSPRMETIITTIARFPLYPNIPHNLFTSHFLFCMCILIFLWTLF